ncbi:MAG: hypothetical protein AAF389_14315 [Gemmatimonadota bacterium]
MTRFPPILLIAALIAAAPLGAQTIDAPSTAVAELPAESLDPRHLGIGPWDRMSALLEVTIFNIDVLTLTVRVDSVTGERLERVASGRSYSDALADSVAAVMLDAEELWAMQIFHRDVGFGRLIGGMTESAEKAGEAGYVSEAYVSAFSETAPELFRFLEEDGTKEGDMILFHVVGESVRTAYLTVDGQLLLNEVGEDAEGRRASVPSFFAPGSRFRERLVKSLPGVR